MSGDVSNRKRLIAVTGGNIRNDHIYFSGHYDFFPKECFLESRAPLVDYSSDAGCPPTTYVVEVQHTLYWLLTVAVD